MGAHTTLLEISCCGSIDVHEEFLPTPLGTKTAVTAAKFSGKGILHK